MENNFNNRANENKVAEAAVEVMEVATKQPFLKTKTGKIAMISGAVLAATGVGILIYRRIKKAKENKLEALVEELQEAK